MKASAVLLLLTAVSGQAQYDLVLKGGHELVNVLRVFVRKLVKALAD